MPAEIQIYEANWPAVIGCDHRGVYVREVDPESSAIGFLVEVQKRGQTWQLKFGDDFGVFHLKEHRNYTIDGALLAWKKPDVETTFNPRQVSEVPAVVGDNAIPAIVEGADELVDEAFAASLDKTMELVEYKAGLRRMRWPDLEVLAKTKGVKTGIKGANKASLIEQLGKIKEEEMLKEGILPKPTVQANAPEVSKPAKTKPQSEDKIVSDHQAKVEAKKKQEVPAVDVRIYRGNTRRLSEQAVGHKSAFKTWCEARLKAAQDIESAKKAAKKAADETAERERTAAREAIFDEISRYERIANR